LKTLGWIVAIALVGLLASGISLAEERPSPSGSEPVLSLKAKVGQKELELQVEKTQTGVALQGKLDEEAIRAEGTQGPDGKIHVEVTKDEETVLEVTLNPEALKPPAPTQAPGQSPKKR
jgi:ribosomal protein L31E